MQLHGNNASPFLTSSPTVITDRQQVKRAVWRVRCASVKCGMCVGKQAYISNSLKSLVHDVQLISVGRGENYHTSRQRHNGKPVLQTQISVCMCVFVCVYEQR